MPGMNFFTENERIFMPGFIAAIEEWHYNIFCCLRP